MSKHVEAFITAREAREHLKLSRPAFYAAVREGVIPARRLGIRRLRFKLSEIEAALVRERVPRTSKPRKAATPASSNA